MASSTVATAASDDTDHPPSRPDPVPVIDLSLLSQSELYTLSLSSDSYDLNRQNDVVIPKINRSVFNESAGSRKQTYSRLRLATADATKTTTLHRRTPHLRASHTLAPNAINDPEQAENSLIIRMLKQLCKSDPDFQDIDVIDEDNVRDNSSIAEVMNLETLGVKRKRGRPRKHENVVFIRPPSSKRLRCGAIKKEVVYDDDKDRGILNERGVVVDLDVVGGLEDPYGPEIRRRTVGMTTEDELLGFLRGLNGHWGSRRRKRRVVDACEFGDVLPKGWKLSLCIKKKEGRVWLFCRRYLSPSGRQFESCKEISTYLISVIGEQKLDKQNAVKINGSDDLALKESSVNAADVVLQEDIKRDVPVANPSPSPSPPGLPPLPSKPEEQVSLDAMEVQAENNVKTDQIGPHVENETEKIEPSPAELDNSDLVLDGDKVITCKESNTDELVVHDLNVVSHSKQDEHCDIDKSSTIEISGDGLGKNGITDDEASRMEVTEQPPDDTVSQSELFGDESMSDKSDREPETFGEIRVNSVEDKLDSNLDQVIDQDNVVMAASVGDGGEDIDVTTTSVGMVDPAVPDIIVEKASICEEKGSDPNMDMDINNTSNELISENEKVVADTSSGIFLCRFGLDKDGATVVNDNDSTNNVDKLSSGLTSSRLDELFDVGTDAFGSYEENELNKNLENDVSFSNMEDTAMQISSNKSEEVKLDDFNIFRNNEPKRNESEDVMDFSTKSNLEFCSLVPSENDQAFGFQDCLYGNTMEECKEESSERGLLNHFSDDIFENKMYSTPLDGLKFDEDRDLNSNELSLAFGNSNVDVHTNLSMVNSSMVEELKSGSSSVGGLFNLSGNVKTSSFQNAWDGIKSDEFKFKGSGSKFTTGFGSNLGQTREEVVPSGMWRTGDRNQLQSGMPMSSHAHIPSPSSFHSFNIMPGKAGDGQFRLDERYNEGYGVSGLRSGRPEPVEFSFLTAGGRSSQHNPHQLQGDSRVFSYNPGMDQQFDSNFWLGKNTMMPNPAGRNQMTAVCALCRTEFQLHPAHFGTQDGIAPLCRSCSAGMSGHANML
ncbi:putative Methyl-CpG-binding domain-containing protein [Helianthus annuus]|uniref:Methyl-CpG-binding domain-containing protein n=1 Tax=Helianthus annuus TaxID=4232 RepID=A0A251VHQ1_HELAN|nr:uncharacterized protein LOC110918106 [Helianthus annuus]KAF5818495.1 putative Methyl-CpG-binding domain-containing protein [Helianthus annuus]KAJ0604766.1 putative Methyl-CpG-binding domain-containing protein [Helianthus annuus]KAJ0618781.1 putative Methyl-CpG-binding domain-containing protein [Helianthus annuus]KAJ0777240.1 putative Methyl-CpG-binding domain-containing protein [Helianthus annuus]KAJ0951825.1 putative Methyl-CpG-binding domain-containing protein [Helianthus annuus]